MILAGSSGVVVLSFHKLSTDAQRGRAEKVRPCLICSKKISGAHFSRVEKRRGESFSEESEVFGAFSLVSAEKEIVLYDNFLDLTFVAWIRYLIGG